MGCCGARRDEEDRRCDGLLYSVTDLRGAGGGGGAP